MFGRTLLSLTVLKIIRDNFYFFNLKGREKAFLIDYTIAILKPNVISNSKNVSKYKVYLEKKAEF